MPFTCSYDFYMPSWRIEEGEGESAPGLRIRIRIRIQSGQWIRPDPDPGGKKLPTKVENCSKSSCFEVLDGLFWELKALLSLGRSLWRPCDG